MVFRRLLCKLGLHRYEKVYSAYVLDKWKCFDCGEMRRWYRA